MNDDVDLLSVQRRLEPQARGRHVASFEKGVGRKVGGEPVERRSDKARLVERAPRDRPVERPSLPRDKGCNESFRL
ncbi:hypothetical protein WOA01_17895 [Methylocystis sp. IM2]|uniref:hypothetical protein n=1 Tax=Methylocystis sp. IM2 TaxID=3136563 RepID=UPI0030F5387E